MNNAADSKMVEMLLASDFAACDWDTSHAYRVVMDRPMGELELASAE